MATRRPGQELARRRLGDALRRARETANIRIDAAARELECSSAKISRLENGLLPAKLWEVRVLLDLYEVGESLIRQRAEQWARDSKEPGWWEDDTADLVTSIGLDGAGLYFAAETEAAHLRSYCIPVLPAQLQTAEYAHAHISACYPAWTKADVKRFVAFRKMRQDSVLRATDPTRMTAVLDESAVRRVVGGRDVHLKQLQWLLDTLDEFVAAGRTSLDIRVLPFAAGVPNLALSPFTIVDPPNPELDRPIVLLEQTPTSGLAHAEHVSLMEEIFSGLLDAALEAEPTRQFLKEVIERL